MRTSISMKDIIPFPIPLVNRLVILILHLKLRPQRLFPLPYHRFELLIEPLEIRILLQLPLPHPRLVPLHLHTHWTFMLGGCNRRSGRCIQGVFGAKAR